MASLEEDLRACYLLLLFGVLLVSPATAVTINPGKAGEALIFPYYSNLGGNQTLIQITNSLRDVDIHGPKALKFHFRDRNGVLVLSFNLYLAESMWTAAVATVDGEAQLILPDNSCTVPQLKQGNSNTVSVPLTSGFFEVINMGSIADQATIDAVKDFDCDRLEAMWAEGGVWRNNDPGFQLKRPLGSLRGAAQLINAQEGTLYSLMPTALADFSDIPQHTAPEAITPNLGTPHDAGTSTGNTQSLICNRHGCTEETWANPRDAVAVLFAKGSLRGEYTISEAIAAKAEVILTNPIAGYEPDAVFLEIEGMPDYFGEYCVQMIQPNPNPLVGPCNGVYGLNVLWLEHVSIISFNDQAIDEGIIVNSDILSEPHLVTFPDAREPTLLRSAGFSINLGKTKLRGLRANSGTPYYGAPVLGVVLQKYSNGFLTNAQGEKIKASYGNAFELSY